MLRRGGTQPGHSAARAWCMGEGAEGERVERQAGRGGNRASVQWHLTDCMLNPHHHPAVSGCCSHLTDEETEASLLVHLFQDLNSPLWLVHEALDSRLNLRPLLWCHADLTLYPREPVAHSINTCRCSQPSHLVCISPQAVGMLQACTCAPESSGSESPSEAGLGQCPSGAQSREGWCVARARGLVPGEERELLGEAERRWGPPAGLASLDAILSFL